jgi:hypothetical protein
MATSGSLVFATGSFQNANGQPTGDQIAYFDGATWRPVGSNGAGNGPWFGDGLALAVYGGQLYAGGGFTSAGGDTLAHGVASRSLRLPDAEIGNFSGNYVGNNVYSSTGAGQTKTMSIARGTSQFFPVLIQNDGLQSASFTLKGTGAATGYTVTFTNYADGANITTAVKNGTFTTGSLARGQNFAMKMTVALSPTAASTGSFYVIASSTVGTPKDVVRGIVNAT